MKVRRRRIPIGQKKRRRGGVKEQVQGVGELRTMLKTRARSVKALSIRAMHAGKCSLKSPTHGSKPSCVHV